TGKALIENPTGKMFIDADMRANAIELDNDSLGDIVVKGRYDNVNGMLSAQGSNLDPEHHIDFDVAMNFKDTANRFQDKIALRPTNFQLKYLERFLGTLVTDIHGYTTGNVNIMPEGGNLDIEGKLQLREAAVKVLFTQVNYTIQDTEIELKKDFLNLDGIVIKDRLGNSGRISGGIKHQGFQNMDFDVAIQTVSPQMELLNTTYRDNQQFYGHAWGSGSFVLLGPQYDMNMFIRMKASETDTSTITLPPAQTRASGLTSFMVEKKYGREMSNTEKRGGETNITYEVNLTATPKVLVELIMDETTGDVIRGRGNGNLIITSGTIAPLRLSGRFNIEEGDYNFTFQSVFKRPFVVRSGMNTNNYIEWNGDPYDANINLEATYTAENVSFSPLASSLIVDAEAARTLQRVRDNVNVVAKITGKLFTPKLDFRLEFPNNSIIYTQPSISFAIEQLQRNNTEMTKQVAFLVVSNSFAPYESTQSLQRPIEELAYNTISGVLFNEINKQLNQIFSRVLRNNNFTLNFSGSLYNRNLLDPNAKGIRLFNQASSTLSVGAPLFNGRAILTVGGSFDIPLESNVQQTFQILPDVQLEVLLNTTGSLRATFFYRQNIDYLNGFNSGGSNQPRRYGASLSYNKEFDSFSEFIFGKRKTTQPVSRQATDSSRQKQTPTTSGIQQKN
ncbi:MAG: hypothetical protein EOO04_23665, partial [Chitinophagaceae bacterium]